MPLSTPWFLNCFAVDVFNLSVFSGLPVVPGVDARFRRVVLRCYLEALAELQGRPADSVTPALVNQYLNFSQICELVSACTT